jgi:hypothetical protein
MLSIWLLLAGALVVLTLLIAVDIHDARLEDRELVVLFACENRSPVSVRVTGEASLYAPSLLSSKCSLHSDSNRKLTIQCPSADIPLAPHAPEVQRILERTQSR